MRRTLLVILFCSLSLVAQAGESWQAALSRMPLGTKATQLNRTNCVKIMLPALQSNNVVKALIFMPGATDEFYMFRRAQASLTNQSPTLLDAVTALTNQTLIRATFRPPFLLLHTDEDPLNPIQRIQNDATAVRLKRKKFAAHVIYDDRDWDYLLPVLQDAFGVRFLPELYSRDSWHFYRHSFAAWNLNGLEALEAIQLAGKTKFTIAKQLVIFEGDARIRAIPKIDHYPDYSN
jgi:hypothetical protein